MAINAIGVIYNWDPYPFILLNLGFSARASYAAPLILMASNRSAERDRMRLEHDSEEVDAILQIRDRQIELLRRSRPRRCLSSSSWTRRLNPPQTHSPARHFVDRARSQTYARRDLPPADEGMI